MFGHIPLLYDHSITSKAHATQHFKASLQAIDQAIPESEDDEDDASKNVDAAALKTTFRNIAQAWQAGDQAIKLLGAFEGPARDALVMEFARLSSRVGRLIASSSSKYLQTKEKDKDKEGCVKAAATADASVGAAAQAKGIVEGSNKSEGVAEDSTRGDGATGAAAAADAETLVDGATEAAPAPGPSDVVLLTDEISTVLSLCRALTSTMCLPIDEFLDVPLLSAVETLAALCSLFDAVACGPHCLTSDRLPPN